MHVSCAGQIKLVAPAFRLRASPPLVFIEAAAGAGLPEPFDLGRAEWDGEGQYVILWPDTGNGYVKLLADGRYSFRHYSPHGAVMSVGRCG